MAMKAWTCDLHGPVNDGDCPKCDDELIAMADLTVTT